MYPARVVALQYGADWDKYTARVPYKIVPYIF
jgi:hypothetical protein